jgi:hypothetical protein
VLNRRRLPRLSAKGDDGARTRNRPSSTTITRPTGAGPSSANAIVDD